MTSAPGAVRSPAQPPAKTSLPPRNNGPAPQQDLPKFSDGMTGFRGNRQLLSLSCMTMPGISGGPQSFRAAKNEGCGLLRHCPRSLIF